MPRFVALLFLQNIIYPPLSVIFESQYTIPLTPQLPATAAVQLHTFYLAAARDETPRLAALIAPVKPKKLAFFRTSPPVRASPTHPQKQAKIIDTPHH